MKRDATLRKNVFEQIADEHSLGGPLGELRQYFASSAKIMVRIRRQHTLRGTCTGTLLAFDKHWNMVLKDVHEDYTVYEPIALPNKTINWVQVHKKRFVKQLFIKGDNVVIVAKANS